MKMYRPFVIGFVGALLAVGMILLAAHMYVDHQLLHVLVTIEQQRETVKK